MMATATLTKLTKAFSQTAWDAYVTKQARAMTKARAKEHPDFKDWTDGEIWQAACDLARIHEAGTIYSE